MKPHGGDQDKQAQFGSWRVYLGVAVRCWVAGFVLVAAGFGVLGGVVERSIGEAANMFGFILFCGMILSLPLFLLHVLLGYLVWRSCLSMLAGRSVRATFSIAATLTVSSALIWPFFMALVPSDTTYGLALFAVVVVLIAVPLSSLVGWHIGGRYAD